MEKSLKRLFLNIRGVVQGVGFRPFIYRLATELNLTGWVLNSSQGVSIEVEGTEDQLMIFYQYLMSKKPSQAQFYQITSTYLPSVGDTKFVILTSTNDEENIKSAIVLPDLATCNDCLEEIFNPIDRRYHYPFTNCTNCGPRYTIIKSLPYDRRYTTMNDFQMCLECQKEYHNPLDRRFHAQPNACPHCGPQIALWDRQGQVIATGNDALSQTVIQISAKKVLAVKGLGGFHLMVDASNRSAVQLLRQRKNRPDKPLAVMYPNIEQVYQDCFVSDLENSILRSPEAPIVLLRKKNQPVFCCEDVAFDNPYLGVMLPANPLHHLLSKQFQFPLVATSGNISDEPICIQEQEALRSLNNIADFFLVHNRPIIRRVDDSIVKVVNDRPLLFRRSRGYTLIPIRNDYGKSNHDHHQILALGGHLKNTIALSFKHQVFLSQHIGDLNSLSTYNYLQDTISSLSEIYNFKPEAIACDAHPDYLSSKLAHKLGTQLNIPVIPVQHHCAHVFSCMLDNRINPPCLGIAWDGTGYGLDGTIWGGEFLLIKDKTWERIAYFKPFPLPGGEIAIKEPRRAALGMLWSLFGEELYTMSHLKIWPAFSAQELKTIATMLRKEVNTPLTSSVGRLFDAIASCLGIRQRVSFEGMAAMELEFIMQGIQTEEYYPFEIRSKVIDWSMIIMAILADLTQNIPLNLISAKFHNTLAEIIVTIAHNMGESQVILTGGCFQNKYLTERSIYRLKQEGFHPFWHHHIPPNDGGIAVGQVMFALYLNN